MKGIFQEIVKNTLILGVVGVLLAYAAPVFAIGLGHLGVSAFATATSYSAAAGLLSHVANPAWLGIFFGGFGGIAEAVKPAMNFLLGKFGKPEAAVETGKGVTPQVFLTLNQQPEMVTTRHRACVEASRTEPVGQELARN